MVSDPHFITGIQAGRLPGDQIPLRMEIDDWWFSKDLVHINQRTLFIRALTIWQEKGLAQGKDPDDLSYFGVAGIHGLPLKPWPSNNVQKQNWYCAHRVQTFATWHTPYLMLYEQQLYREMIALIPNTFDESQHAEYRQAADSWRLPYWDWAMKKPTWAPSLPLEQQYEQPHKGPNVPFAITLENVEVRAGKGSITPSVTVRNPLFQFALAEGTAFGGYGVKFEDNRTWVGKCRVTSRWPSTTDAAKPTFQTDYVNGKNQDYQKVTSQLQGSVGDLKDPRSLYFANSLPEAVLRLITTRSATNEPGMPYNTFVTTQWQGGGPKDYPSLEAIHNNMHGFIGGNGYMGNPGTAGFDPIFWLHHCNVDRLLSVWQELYPTAYQTWLNSDPKKKDPTGPNAELVPFKDDQGKGYTSISCSYKHKDFNYTYPDLQSWKFPDRKDYVNSIYSNFERLYSYSPKTSLMLKKNAVVAKQQMASMTAKNLEVENFPAPLIAEFPPTENNVSTVEKFGKPPALQWDNDDYLLNVLYEPFALGGEPYNIVVYLGDIPETTQSDNPTPVDFRAESTAISTVYNFSSTVEARGFDETGCENCKQHQEERILSSGQVILTDYLIERIVQARPYQGLTLQSLDLQEVLAYLRANLHWIVQTTDGRIIPNNDERVERMSFSIAHGAARHSSDPAQLSRYGPYSIALNMTATGAVA